MKYIDFVFAIIGTFGAGFLTMLFIIGMINLTEFEKANIFSGIMFIIPIGAALIFLAVGLYLMINLILQGKNLCKK